MFRLDQPIDEHGTTLRASLERLADNPKIRKRGGHPDLIPPRVPLFAAYLWEWYQELNGSRQVGMAANPLTYTEIQAWAAMTGRKPDPWEVEQLKTLDLAWLEIVSDTRSKAAERQRQQAEREAQRGRR